MDSKYQKIKKRIHLIIFILGIIILSKLFISFLFDVGYDPSAGRVGGRASGGGIMFAVGLAVVSSALFTFIINIIFAIVEVMFLPNKDVE